MFIVKNSPDRNAYRVIAGEMINRELSINHYLDGKPRETLPQDYVGYPSYVSGNKKYSLKLVRGHIYIPDFIEKEAFVNSIMKILGDIEAPERLDGRDLNTTSCSATVPSNLCSDIIVDVNTRRKFMFTPERSTYSQGVKFVWIIQHISEINVKIDSRYPQVAIAQLAGIFWDFDNVLSLPHNSISFDFGKVSFKAFRHMTKERVILILHAHNPLIMELSEIQIVNKDHNIHKVSIGEYTRDISLKKVYTASIDQVIVRPIRLENDVTSTEVCILCHEPLYDDIYGLCGRTSSDDPIISTDGKIFIDPVCSLCLHTTEEESAIERKYMRVIRVKWSKTTLDIIKSKNFSAEKEDICIEVLKGVIPYQAKINTNTTVNFYLIGEKYVGFTTKNHYMYTALANEHIMRGRKACRVTVL